MTIEKLDSFYERIRKIPVALPADWSGFEDLEDEDRKIIDTVMDGYGDILQERDIRRAVRNLEKIARGIQAEELA